MSIDERINNLVKVAELHQQSLDLQQGAIERNTSAIQALIELVRKHEEELKVVRLTLARLAEGYHQHD